MTSLSRVALAATLSLLACAQARAADNYTIQSGGATRTIRAKDVGGVLLPQSIAVDGAGTERFTDANPATVKLPSGQVVVLGAGSASIGTVGVTSLPALPAGTNTIGSIANISGTVSLPTGAATSAKQPALGVAGTPSTDVLSVQGVPNGTPQPTDTVIRSTPTDRGGTITAGGTAQQLMAANTTRRGFLIQNQSTGDLYINALATAAANQTSLRIPAGALYETSPHHSGTGTVSIFGATTGQTFYAREF